MFSNMVVVGASGDLAQKKILPALFALYSQGLLPPGFRVFGFGRTPWSDDAFRDRATERLTCRYVPQRSCGEYMQRFLACCHYVAGSYDSPDSFLNLYERMRQIDGRRAPRSIFYLAVPPRIYLDVAQALAASGLVLCSAGEDTTRVVVEKPFGRDRESSDRLGDALAQVFPEDQTYRIDHYLGKELIQNLMVLRFANSIFEPLWNRRHVRSVEIAWQEDIGVEDRGRYFDEYGIIRDVMQNHLLQILALIAMECPARLDALAVQDEKVRVLRAIPPLQLNDIVVGQYGEATAGRKPHTAYRKEKYVSPDSLTPTYAAAVLEIRNERWTGVPFFLRAGKGMDSRLTEIRVRFHDIPRNLFRDAGDCLKTNELVIRVQPDEAIFFRIVNKVPGVKMALAETDLDLRYSSAFEGVIPDAYEYLLLDVLEGDRSLFIRRDELAAAWDVFTPVLHRLERERVAPAPYGFGSRGPDEADALARRAGVAI